MEALITIISLSLLIGLISSPILIIWRLNKINIKFTFIYYLIIGIVATVFLTLSFAWWTNKSDKILLTYYGYNINGMNDTEFYEKVLPENIKRVKSLEISIMGIGWPLKAIMTYMFYSPYLLIVYLASYLLEKRKQKITPN